MATARTPGPWAYVRNPENTRWIIDSAPAHAIACTAGYEPDNEANARLIAAAPELLDLLYRWQASGCPHCPGDCAGANPPSATCIVRATAAAIAKATGK